MQIHYNNSAAFAKTLDEQDSLKQLRDSFIIPERDGIEQVYFLGNSLGLQPKTTAGYIQQVLQQWSEWGVVGFTKGKEPWWYYHDKLTAPLARIVGALPQEVVVMNQLTVNLHLMMISFYQPQGTRTKILCEAKAFPSDQYMLETHVRQRGLNAEEVIIEVQPRSGEVTIQNEDIVAAIELHKDELALVLWGGVNYYTGQVFDMQAITEAAHKAGAKVGFDLAHAVGNIPLQLHQWNVDFACWCSYKYLNSGPGAVAGTFIHERYHKDSSLPRFAGWWGYERATQFQMPKGFVPIATAEGWGLSTPSPMLYAAHQASLAIFENTDLNLLFSKGQQLSSYLIFLVNEINSGLPEPIIRIITPEKAKGSQVSLLMLQHGKRIYQYISGKGIFADWREPDVIRVAPAPLYNTFSEVYRFGQVLAEACKMVFD